MSELDAIIPNIYQGFLYELRLKNELTQIDLAQCTGVSVRTLGAMESFDKRSVSRKVVARLAKFFGYKTVLNFTECARAFNTGHGHSSPPPRKYGLIIAAIIAACLVTVLVGRSI